MQSPVIMKEEWINRPIVFLVENIVIRMYAYKGNYFEMLYTAFDLRLPS